MARKIEGYWMLICNPQKWAIDRFLEDRISVDTWGVGKTYQHKVKSGHLAILRVGNDRRTKKELKGRSRLKPGIYAVCEIIGDIFPGHAANDKYWSDEHRRQQGYPTVKIRYLHTFEMNPLSLKALKSGNGLDGSIVSGHQNSMLPIRKSDFDSIIALANISANELNVTSADNSSYKDASPTVKEITARRIERGPEGDRAKKINKYECQICRALGKPPLGFQKRDSILRYVEAHHVIQVSTLEKNTLSIRNIMTVCASHHRWLHYGNCDVTINGDAFVVKSSDYADLFIPRLSDDAK